MQEAPLLQNEHRMVRVDDGACPRSVPAEEGFDQTQGMLMRGELAKLLWAQKFDPAAFRADRRKTEAKELRALCQSHRRRVLDSAAKSSFARDLAWVRAHSAENRYRNSGVLSETEGWRAERAAFERLRPFLTQGVRNYGRWCINPGRPAGIPLRASECDAARLLGARQSGQE